MHAMCCESQGKTYREVVTVKLLALFAPDQPSGVSTISAECTDLRRFALLVLGCNNSPPVKKYIKGSKSETATDAGRLARVVSVLEEAAQHLQVLILTCRLERYRGLKQAVFFDLEDKQICG